MHRAVHALAALYSVRHGAQCKSRNCTNLLTSAVASASGVASRKVQLNQKLKMNEFKFFLDHKMAYSPPVQTSKLNFQFII